MFNPNQIRSDFPSLEQKIDGKAPIYFDNACVTLRPRPVITAIKEYYEKFPACAGRSSHTFAQETTRHYEEARRTVARFINASANEIVFTRNTTEGINLVAYSLYQQDLLTDRRNLPLVFTSDKEHNSNLIPWIRLAKSDRIKHIVLPSRPDQSFNLENFQSQINQHKNPTANLPTPNLLSLVYTSNLDGVTNPVREIIQIAHENNFLVLLDAAQAISHQKIDVKKLDADFLAFSGHKMLGPAGIGILYGKYKLLEQLPPFLTGGETVTDTTYNSAEFQKPPHKFEAGLQNYPGSLGLATAIEYLEKVGLEKIHQHATSLNEYLTSALSSLGSPASRLKILGPSEAKLRGGILSFYFAGFNSHKIALLLDSSSKIMVRSGVFCLHSFFNAHQIPPALRVSLYLYNTLEECQIFIETLRKILKTVS